MGGGEGREPSPHLKTECLSSYDLTFRNKKILN